MIQRRLSVVLSVVLLAVLLLPGPAHADAVTDTIGIYVGYYGWAEEDYLEKVTYHWTELDDWVGGALDTQETIYSYYSGSRTYLVAARGFSIRDLLSYAGIDFNSIASIDFFTQDHSNGAYRTFSKGSLFDQPRYYFPNLAANEETGELYPWDGEDIWDGATTVEAMLALEDYTEWDTVGSEFQQRYDSTLLSPNSRFHLFFGQADPTEASTSSAAKYCYKILITFAGTPVLGTEETDMTLKLGSDKKLTVMVDAEDGLLNDYVLEHLAWTSSDETVLTVAEDGTLSVHGSGQATVTASFGASSVSVQVTVDPEEEPEDEQAIGTTAPNDGGSRQGTGSADLQGQGTGIAESPSAAQEAVISTAQLPQEVPEMPDPVIPEEVGPEPETEAPETPETLETVAPEPAEQLPAVELPEPQEVSPKPEPVSGQQLFMVRPEALAGMEQSSPNAQSTAGRDMEEDSTQLVVVPQEVRDWTVPVLITALGAFSLGFGFELVRFQHLLKKR